MNIFDTDFYQLTMAMSYILDNTADDTVGFEAFYRHPKKSLNSDLYIFSGENEIRTLIGSVRSELNDESIGTRFYNLIEHRIPAGKEESYKGKVLNFFKFNNTSFEYSVYPEGKKLLPYMPYFQYKGPKWIGQLLETNILATTNGITAMKTLMLNNDLTKKESQFFETLCLSKNPESELILDPYFDGLVDRAREYNDAKQDIILLDASFRRAPSKEIAIAASKVAINEGWDGTANVAALQRGVVESGKVGGTHAHSLIMANAPYGEDSESNAFEKWDKSFPNSTMLIDTYDTMLAIDKIILANIYPSDVRIDSEPLEELAVKVRHVLDRNDRKKCGIFLSGDMTPERLIHMNNIGTPVTKTMAGTMYVNYGETIRVNSGFVYKIVEVTGNGKTYYPEKAAPGKKSMGGLKKVIIEKGFEKSDNWGIFN